jgi:4-amino-4-deoxy-L-arabinose transferase-like glycosyltransferase
MIDQEHRERGNARRRATAIGLIVAVAAVLRFWGLSGGIPSSLGVDEPQIMIRSLAMVRSGDFNPHFFDYPGFYLYLQAGVIVVKFLAGASSGAWWSLSHVGDHDFYLWGRALTAVFGTATVYLVYLAGRRWGTPHALLAAGLLAVLPVHVRESHFVLTDVPTAFFVALAFVLSLRAHERGTGSAFAWAGAAAGLATGTKYTAWVAILLPLAAAAMAAAPFDVRVRRAIAASAAFFGAFLLAAPYTVLDLPGFLNGFGTLAAAVPKRPPSAEPGWIVYLKHLRIALGWPGFALGGVGLILFAVRVVRGPARVGSALVLLVMPVFWLMIIDRTLIFARYLIPIVPFVCLLVATAVVSCASGLRRVALPRMAVATLVVALNVAVLAKPALTSISWDREMSRPTTVGLAREWISARARPGTRIVHELPSLHFLPGLHYRVEYLTSLTEKGLDFYLGGRADYVVATSAVYGPFFSAPDRFQEQHRAYQDLFERLTPVFSVDGSRDHPGPDVRVFSVAK